MVNLSILGGEHRGGQSPVDELRGAGSVLQLILPADPFDLAGGEVRAGGEWEAHRSGVNCGYCSMDCPPRGGGVPLVAVEEVCHRLLVFIVGFEAVGKHSGHLAIELLRRGQVAPLGEDLLLVNVGVVAGHGLGSFGML